MELRLIDMFSFVYQLAVFFFESIFQLPSLTMSDFKILLYFVITVKIGFALQMILLFKSKRKILNWLIPIVSFITITIIEITAHYSNINIPISLYIIAIVYATLYLILFGCLLAVIVFSIYRLNYAMKHRKRLNK